MRLCHLIPLLVIGCLVAQTAPPEKPTDKPDDKPKVTADSPLGDPAPLPDGAPPQMASIDRDGLRAHEFWLADDARKGRFTGSPQQLETAKYIAAHFQKLGLEPLGDKKGYLQYYPLDSVLLDANATSLTFGQTKLTSGLAVLAASENDKVSISGRFLFCGNGSPDAVPNGIKGKIPVVVAQKPPRGAQGSKVADIAALHRCADIAREFGNEGAAAGVICMLDGLGPFTNSLNYEALLPDHPRQLFQGKGPPLGGRVPVLFLAEKESRLLLLAMGVAFDDDGKPDHIDKDQKLSGKLQITVKHDPKGTACNVVAMLPGKDRKKEAVVFSAHMDHIGTRIDGDVFNGADDNASGTSGLLEIAEAFAKGERPSRSVIFLSVSGEELGLYGSGWFANNPTFPLDQIIADVNIDMIGRATSKDGSIQMQLTPSYQHPKYSTLARHCASLAGLFHISLTSGDQYFTRSDHYNFAQKNIPVMFLCDGEPPQYHQVDDSPDTIDYASMEAVARLAFWAGWAVANDKDKPKELGAQSGW